MTNIDDVDRRWSLLGLIALLFAAGVAGCIGTDDAPEAGSLDPDADGGDETTAPPVGEWSDGIPVSTAFVREECTLELAEALLPPGLSDQIVPSGVEPAPYHGAPGTASLLFVASSCTDDRGEPASELWGYVPIETPEGVEEEEALRAVVPIGSFVDSGRLLDIYEAWNLSAAYEGNVTVETLQDTQPARSGHVLATDGDFTLHVYASAPGEPAENPAGGLRAVHLDGGTVASTVDILWPEHAALEGAAKIAAEGESSDPFLLAFDGLEGEAYAIPGPVPLETNYTLHTADDQDAAGGFVDAATVGARPQTVLTGFNGGEPSIGVLPSGSAFVQAMSETIRSTDGGESWERVYNYSYETLHGTYGSWDPMLWVDDETERVYWNHLAPDRVVATERCSTIGFSEDEGDSWERNDRACTTDGLDFQKLAGGPPGPEPNPMAGEQHPTVLYLCYNKQLPATSTYDTHCSMSYDGGESWPVESRSLECPGCGGGAGRPAVAPDGTAYVPMWGQIAVSEDSGLTWRTLEAPAGVAVKDLEFTPDGTMYALGFAAEGLRVARSTDGAASWEGSWSASPPGVQTSAFEVLEAGDDGHVGVAIVGTNHSLDDPVNAPEDARWNLHVAVSDDAADGAPTFATARATEDPVQVGPLCTYGGCRDTGARNLLDFIDSDVGPEGTFYVSYADGCTGECATASDPAPEDSRDDATAVAWVEGFPLAETDR